MKRKACILALFLLALSHAALATDWELVEKGKFIGITFNSYVDRDSAVVRGDTVIYWRLQVNEVPDPLGYKKILNKIEARRSGEWRVLETYKFDENNKQTFSYNNPSSVGEFVSTGDSNNKEIATALKYAKAGLDTSAMPAP